jgi:hypothetical protein
MTITSSRPELSALAEQYAADGFVLVKGLLSKEEAAYYRQRSHDLLAQLNRHDDPTWKSRWDCPTVRPGCSICTTRSSTMRSSPSSW